MLGEPSPDTALLEFMYACPVGLVEIDRVGLITMINPHAMKHLLPIAAQTRRAMTNLFEALEDCAPELRNMFETSQQSQGIVCENHRIVVDVKQRREDRRKVLAFTLVKLSQDRCIATVNDVTAQVEQERRLKLADAWFSSLLHGVNDYAVLSVSADGTIESVNEGFMRQTGHACLDVMGQPLRTMLTLDGTPWEPSMSDQFRIAKSDGWALNEGWQRRRNGDRYWCQRLIVARVGNDGSSVEGYTVVLRDVARQESGNTAELRRLLTEDHLTGAANRAHFLQRLEQFHRLWSENGQPLSLVLIDVDHFKSVNDRWGHPAGDLILRSLTRTCMATLRQDSVFSRLGGEEFAALLPNTTLAEAVAIAERLRLAIENDRVNASGQVIGVTASLGCVAADDRASSIDDMIRIADELLYEAKRTGRNRVCSVTVGTEPVLSVIS